MNVFIRDDFDPRKIISSGQCFRAAEIEPGLFRFMTGRHVLYMKQISPVRWSLSCSAYAWRRTWKPYFDWGRNYREIRESVPPEDPFLQKCASYGKGLRILRQDPLETLITFIISQRKSIPAIRSSLEKLCAAAGEEITTPYETLRLFPTEKALSALSLAELRNCSLGYRAPYIYKTAARLAANPSFLKTLNNASDQELIDVLCTFPGVGIKVACCTALFGYGRTAASPVDVWISRVIREKYGGTDPFSRYGKAAGIMQQYLFYWAQTTKMKESLPPQ